MKKSKIDCNDCKKETCPDDCVVSNVFKRAEQEPDKYVAYINEASINKVKADALYKHNVGSIDVLPYYLVLGSDRYQIVKFGVEKRPAVTRNDIRKYIESCITKDFWMARHF